MHSPLFNFDPFIRAKLPAGVSSTTIIVFNSSN